jgi:hypothetical protein
MLVVVATVWVKREVRGWFTPSGVRKERSPERPASDYLWWYVGAVSRPEPDSNAAIPRSRHNVISAIIEVKCSAVGGDTVGEEHATPLVVIDRRIAVVANGGSAGLFFITQKKSKTEIEVPEHTRGRRLTLFGACRIHRGASCTLEEYVK